MNLVTRYEHKLYINNIPTFNNVDITELHNSELHNSE
jgi:hypothetical protein